MELPFALDEINLYQTIFSNGYVIGRKSSKSTTKVFRYDIWILNEDKEVCVELLGFATRPYTALPKRVEVDRSSALTYLISEWQARVLEQETKVSSTVSHLIFHLDTLEDFQKLVLCLQARMQEKVKGRDFSGDLHYFSG